MRRAALILFFCAVFIYNLAFAFQESRQESVDLMLAQLSAATTPLEPQPEDEQLGKKILLGSEVAEDEPEKIMSLGFSDEATFMPKSGANAMEGGVSFAENNSELSYEYKIMGKIPLEFSLLSGYTSINNSTNIKLPAKLTSLGMNANITLPLFLDKTYFRLSLDPTFNSDDWVIKGSTFRIPFNAIAIYQPNKKLIIGLGVAVSPHYKFRNIVAPIYGFIYKPDDKWTFNLLSDRPQVLYQFNKKLALFFETSFTNEEYVVKTDNINEIVIRNFDNRYGFGATYKVNKYIEASAAVGGVVDRTLKYRDGAGKVAIGPGMYSQIRIDISI